MQMEQLKSLFKAFSYYCRYYHLVYHIKRIKDKRARLLILTYHNLFDEPKPGTPEKELFQLRPSVTKREFESHLRVLKKRFRIVSLPNVVREIREKGRLEDDSVAITFDDGYESFYRLAFPLLRKYDFPATVFLPTDFIDNHKMFWWDKLSQIIFCAPPPPEATYALNSVIGKKRAQQFRSAANDIRRKKEFLESLESYLRNLEDGQRKEKIENLKEILQPDKDPKSENLNTLSWDQITEMFREEISFGSHTCSHSNLKFASLEKVEEELAKSKEAIEKNIKGTVDCFAYPYGVDLETHFRIKPILSDLRYECACTCLPGVNSSSSDPLFLKRTALPMTTFGPVIARELLLNYSGKFKKELSYA